MLVDCVSFGYRSTNLLAHVLCDLWSMSHIAIHICRPSFGARRICTVGRERDEPRRARRRPPSSAATQVNLPGCLASSRDASEPALPAAAFYLLIGGVGSDWTAGSICPSMKLGMSRVVSLCIATDGIKPKCHQLASVIPPTGLHTDTPLLYNDDDEASRGASSL